MSGRNLVGLILALACIRIAWADDGPKLEQPLNKVSFRSTATSAHVNENLKRLRDAFRIAKGAKSLEDFQRVLQICDQCRNDKPTRQVQIYVDRLAAWTHNERGESYAAAAVSARKKNKNERQAQFENAALKDFETAVQLNPKAWRSVHNRAISYAVVGRNSKALADFDRAIQLNSNYANAWFNRGELKAQLGQHGKAVADYDRALRLRPNDASSHAGRAYCFYQLGQLRKSLGDYDRAMRLDPNNADALLERGIVHVALEQWELARNDFKRAVDVDSELMQAHYRAAWLATTCPVKRLRNPEYAFHAIRRAMELGGARDERFVNILIVAQNALRSNEPSTVVLTSAAQEVKEQGDSAVVLATHEQLSNEAVPDEHSILRK